MISSARDEFHNRLKAIETKSQADSSIQEISKIYENAKAELERITSSYYEDLLVTKRKQLSIQDEYDDFRKKNGRIGLARFSEYPTMSYGLIFLIAIIEILTNAYALGASHPEGPAGVVLEIFMFCIVNVGVAFLLGYYVWRWFYHKSIVVNIGGYMLAIPMITFLIFINFFLAHYRDSISKLVSSNLEVLDYGKMMLQLGRQSLENLLSSSFMMDDFKSYLLLFVGLFVAILATKKFFDLDDPYPGYGKLERDKSESVKGYDIKRTKYHAYIIDLVDEYSAKINNLCMALKSSENIISERKKEKEHLYEKYKNWLANVQPVGVLLYAFYRQENMKARKSKKEPPCFIKHKYKCPDSAQVKRPPSKIFISKYPQTEKICKKYVNDLNKTLNDHQKKFEKIDSMSLDDTKSI